MKEFVDRVGLDLIISFVVGVGIAIVGLIVLSGGDNTAEAPTVIPSNEDSFVADGTFVCDGVSFTLPEGWNGWSQQFDETAQCFISTWDQDTIPENLDLAYPDNVATIVNFTYDIEGTLQEHLEATLPSENDPEISAFDLPNGDGAQVVSGEDIAYYYKNDTTIVNMFVTRTTDEALRNQAIAVIGGLQAE